ncbi:MAG: GNAT family N-acetyltransferase [Candidatus Geothermarchaeales archaeon]
MRQFTYSLVNATLDSEEPRPESIRMCRKGDFQILCELNRTCFAEPTTPVTMKVHERLHQNTIFIAEVGETPVGYVLGLMSQVRPEEGWIRQFGVIPPYRRKGMAERLVRREVEAMKGLEARYIGLTVSPSNIPSINLGNKIGFKVIDEGQHETYEADGNTVVRDYYGPGEDRVMMRLYLSDEERTE